MVVFTESACRDGANDGAVHVYLRRALPSGRGADGNGSPARLPRGKAYGVALGAAGGYRVVLAQVAPALVPGIIVHLVQRVVIVGRRIEGVDEGRAVHRERFAVALGEEIIAAVGVWVACADVCVNAAPRHRPLGMEQPAAVNGACGHLLEVVIPHKVFFPKHFVLESSAISVHLHTAHVRQSGTAYQVAGYLVNARGRHAYLGPTALAQHGVDRIAAACVTAATGPCRGRAAPLGRRLHLEHEADELHLLAATLHQGRERHVEPAALAVDNHVGRHFGHSRERPAACAQVSADVALAHLQELGILYPGGVDGVSPRPVEGHGIREEGQHAVYPHLFGRKVEELLHLHLRRNCEHGQHGSQQRQYFR